VPPGQTRPKSAKEANVIEENFSIPIRWESTSRNPILFTNQIFVRAHEDHFIVTFGQTDLPYEVELSEETKERLGKQGLPIQVVARLAIAPASMGQFIQHLTAVHDSWQKHEKEAGVS